MTRTDILHRTIEPELRSALRAFRVVVLQGPRQSGKTTLAQQLRNGGTFLSLDDPTLRSLALDDPTGFVAGRTPPVIIDEIQRGGDSLVRAIKIAVDADPRPGRFLLTGSAGFLTVPVLSESLAGRAVLFDLAPFSEVEIEQNEHGLLQRLLSAPGPPVGTASDLSGLSGSESAPLSRFEYAERICRGGYPEVIDLSVSDRQRWFSSYVHTVVARDIVELTGARRSTELPRLLNAVAARTAGELVVQDLHRDLEFGSIVTTSDYLSFLEMTYLVSSLPGWASGVPTRAKRRPKIHLSDTGLAAAILGVSAESLSDPSNPSRGPLHESFVVNELRRQASALEPGLRFYHYRDSRGREIDLLIERPDGRIIAVEVKAGSTVRPSDAKHLYWLRDSIGDRFEQGLILHTGEHSLNVSERVLALPQSRLWDLSPE